MDSVTDLVPLGGQQIKMDGLISGSTNRAEQAVLIELYTWFTTEFVQIRHHDEFSPEWETTYEACRKTYLILESERQQTKVSRLEWQDEIDKYFKSMDTRRYFNLGPLPDNSTLWDMVPLSIFLDRHNGTSSQDRSTPWNTALNNWALFRRTVHTTAGPRKAGTQGKSPFLNLLSPAQLSSFEALEQWWTSSYFDTAATQAVIESLESLRKSPVFTERACLAKGPATGSHYQWTSAIHFCAEFLPQRWEPFDPLKGIVRLLAVRRESVELAITQRLAYTITDQPVSPENLSRIQSYPELVKRDNGWFSRITFVENPFYLWDALLRKTVMVDELPQLPKYTCISHTWGRWRKNSSVAVPGVDWPVPENTQYDVRELPQFLGQLGDRYIWFDLFCIPQSGDDERMNIEIGNQAAIFRKSERCIAWLNDDHVTSWDSLRKALKWLALRYLRATNLSAPIGINASLGLAAEAASEPVELMNKGSPVGWFTSLWTLQEASLCPNLQLVSRDWTEFGDGKSSLSLSTLLASVGVMKEYAGIENPRVFFGSFAEPYREKVVMKDNSTRTWPTGVRSLVKFSRDVSLNRVLKDLHPMTILTDASRREYTGDRAEGIMSAINVTDWWREAKGHGLGIATGRPPATLDGYPLPFVQEAARKLGAAFFLSYANPSRVQPSLQTFGPGGFASGSRTMLPFAPSNMSEGGNHALSISMVDHESVASWRITEEGHVRAGAAGIAYHPDGHAPELFGMPFGPQSTIIFYLDQESSGTKTKCLKTPDDLSTLLSSLTRGGARLYAVALFDCAGEQHGIILLELPRQDADGATRMFVKTGHYQTSMYRMPPTTEDIDWLIL